MSKPRFEVRDASNEYDEYNELWDNELNECVNSDHGEPEDQTLTRNFAWVPELLNELDAKIKSLELELESRPRQKGFYES